MQGDSTSIGKPLMAIPSEPRQILARPGITLGRSAKMERFHKTPLDTWGCCDIVDIMNTEPVCHIFAKYHPYAPDVILEALNKFEEEHDIQGKTKKLLEETK